MIAFSFVFKYLWVEMEIVMNSVNEVKDTKNVAEIIAIKEFIEKKSKENFNSFYADIKIQKVKDTLRKCSETTPDQFTFTVGDINTYLG